jgi:hypothetical protein
MREKSEKLRNDIALLQASAETLKSEANTLIERSKEIAKEIDKRTIVDGRENLTKIDAA